MNYKKENRDTIEGGNMNRTDQKQYLVYGNRSNERMPSAENMPDVKQMPGMEQMSGTGRMRCCTCCAE